MKTRQSVFIAGVLLVFVAILVFIGIKGKIVGGFDLTSSYVGCRLFTSDQTDHLYASHGSTFTETPDVVWKHIASQDKALSRLGGLPPYVQTPLWAYSLQPLCRVTTFDSFQRVFMVLTALCFAGIIWLTAKFWCPRLLHPMWIAIFCAGWLTTEPLRYAISLTQTHVIFLLLSLIGIVCAERGWAVWAGALVAVAAAVKITPIVLLVYWLVTGRRKAALSLAVVSAAILLLTLALTGGPLVALYAQSTSRMSNLLLVSFNNQSLAAWWAAHRFPQAEIYDWHSFALPAGLKLFSLLLLLVSILSGGYMDRRSLRVKADAAPFGAIFTLLGATMCTPLAWSHYYILLIVPVMMMVDRILRRRSWLLILLFAVTVLLNIYYFVRAHLVGLHLPEIVRAEFYAGAVAMLALVYMHQRSLRHKSAVK